MKKLTDRQVAYLVSLIKNASFAYGDNDEKEFLRLMDIALEIANKADESAYKINKKKEEEQ